MNRKRILFVDDEQSLLDGLQDILRQNRHEWDMVFVSGGETALAELARAPFDVIVSDMRMPGMDGATLLRHVQDEYPKLARIVLSGHADREAVVRALPVAHQYLSKPCDAAVLRQVIEQTCNLQTLLHDDAIRVVAGRLDRLPSVPACYLELTNVVARPGSGLADVARILEKDPAMSAKVLQLVNSAYFGTGQRITSVQRAVVYLGIDLIQGLVLTTQVFETLKGMPMRGGLSLESMQEHAILSARLAKRFVRDQSRAEEAFAAAIVHDIGKVVLALGFPDGYGDVQATARQQRRPTYQVEKEALGVTHAEAGGYLLGVWGLPYSIVETVAYHHTPRLATAGSRDVLAAVHVADALVDSVLGGKESVHQRDMVDVEFLEENGLGSLLSEWEKMAIADLHALVEAR